MKADVTPQDRRTTWTPPPRPDWVAKINQEGTRLDIKGIVPLTPDSLIKTAIANTGLSDFGGEDWREPFEVFCKGLDADAELTLMGRIMTRSDLLMLLEGRLQVEHAYKLHPEIDDQEITAPILIVGQGRTGTSAMLNLLSEDPGNAVERTWQALFPGLPPEGENDEPRIRTADERMRMWSRVTPEMDSIHEFSANIPTECIHIQCLSFQSPAWQAIFGQTPALFHYMAGRGMVNSVAYEKRVLKLLQWRYGESRWILKSPDALNYLPDVLKVYPDLRLIWMHRDPVKSFSSAVSLVGTLTWARSDMTLSPGSFDTVTDLDICSAMITRPIDWIEQGLLPKQRLCNIQYLDFITDPMREVERIYEFFDLELSVSGRNGMETYLANNPRSSRPAHKYNTGNDSIVSKERLAFRRYQEYFKVPNEV
ncbi:sulfotransferase [Acidocella sp. KAb 2-4]|uniref:sulfotransferase family protein n=1 Tax=Acidocella sp. KAb 2-4 TaxID=2885158 RepID=UPI001D08F34F|nr:sulfotransferase [Acidocella sp. KAb 2-4]MCB5946076.1 sulfotransferase [Acidocella sp. KAb 2-4]